MPVPRRGACRHHLLVDEMFCDESACRVAHRRRGLGVDYRPLARFPAGSLKFRTVGLPEYGFNRLLRPKSASASRGLKAPAYPPPSPRVGFDLRVSLRGRGPRAKALAVTAGTMSRPRVLPSPAVIVSAGSSVLPADPPGLGPPPDFAGDADTGGLALRGCSGRAPSPSLLG